MAIKFHYKDFRKEYKRFAKANDKALSILLEPVFDAWHEALPYRGITDCSSLLDFSPQYNPAFFSTTIYSVDGKLVRSTLEHDEMPHKGYISRIEFKGVGIESQMKEKNIKLEQAVLDNFRDFFRRELGIYALMKMGKKEMLEATCYAEDDSLEWWVPKAFHMGEHAIAFYHGKKVARETIKAAKSIMDERRAREL